MPSPLFKKNAFNKQFNTDTRPNRVETCMLHKEEMGQLLTNISINCHSLIRN